MDNSYRSWTYTDPANPFYVETTTDEAPHQTIYTRDATTHRVLHILYPDQSTEDFSYNGFGQVLTHKLTSGGTETFTYDTRGLKQTSYPPATESDPDPWNHPTLYFYYTTGPSTDRLQRVQDPRGNSTSYEYNARGQVTKVTHQDGTYTQSGYNGDGTLAWTADENHPGAATDPTQRTRYTYDEYRRVVTVTNPMGETTITDYALDWVHPLAHTTNNPHYVLSPGGKNTFFDYDANLRKKDQAIALSSPDESWTLFEYDAVGNLTKITDPRFKETKFGYDGRNRKIWMDDPIASDRNSTGHTMNWEYDYVGNKTRETRADNAFRSWDYDSMNRLVDHYGFAGERVVRYDRNIEDTWEWITDAKNATYTIHYDALHRKTGEYYPADATSGGRAGYFWYDEAGNLVQFKNPGDQYQHFYYDSRNRQRHSWWDGNAAQDIGTNYDAASRMTDITTNSGETVVAFGYDDANRQVWEDQTLAGYPTPHVTTHRDADGNRADLSVDNYYQVYFDYTQRNQLWHIYGGGYGGLCNFSYDPAGNLTKRQSQIFWPNSTNLAYDELNRATMVEQTGYMENWMARTWYQYDNVGREVARWRDEDEGMGPGRGERFGYNVLGQITRAQYNAQQVWTGNAANAVLDQSYDVTPLNRNAVWNNGQGTAYAFNALNQYTSVNGAPYNYDGNFNLAAAPNWSGAYDGQSRLMTAGHDGNVAFFTYDGLGRCVRRIVYAPDGSFKTLIFAYDGWNPVVEYDGAAALVGQNVYGAKDDELVLRWSNVGGWLIPKLDRNGNVLYLLDGSNVRVENYKYDAYGKPTILSTNNAQLSTSAVGNRFMFEGREWISQMGIYDYRHRMYQPDLGRFLQTDPMGLQTEGSKLTTEQKALYSPGGSAPETFSSSEMNLYRYCGDDPVDRSDPLGLLPPGPGLMDVPKDMLTKMYDASNKNVEHSKTDIDRRPGASRVEEFRTVGYKSGNKEQSSSIKGFHDPSTIQKKAHLPPDPFNGKGKPAWDTHSHVGGDGKPFGSDKPTAEYLHVPLGVQSTTGGTKMYLYVPMDKGRGGEVFYTNDGLTLFNMSREQVPH
jgi:RHS repeat-associated protein